MTMKVINIPQGCADWHQHRRNHRNASDAPAVMGAGRKTRTALLHAIATGEAEDISPQLQALFDRGHAAEASIRPHVEAIIGDDLFPVVGVSDEHPLLSASFDGLTMCGRIVFEHKLWNAELAAKVARGEDLDPLYYWQLEHQLLVSGAELAIFVVSDGTPENMVYCWYEAVPGRREALLAGWAQFEADLAAYVPATPKAQAVAAPVETLPAIVYQIDRGTMALTSNLKAFRAAAESLVERTKAPLVTDQDFADREALCKAFGDAEKLLKMKAEEVVGQIEDVARFSRELGDIAEQFRAARLASEKLVEAEKKARREAIRLSGVNALVAHVQALEARFAGRVRMPLVTGDFAGAIKGKRTLTSIQDAVDTELAQRKIEANQVADAIDANLRTLDELAPDHLFLFRDLQQLVAMPAEAFRATVEGRVATRKAQEQARIEAERERIAREEREKAEREARAKVEAEERARREAEVQARQQAAREATPPATPDVPPQAPPAGRAIPDSQPAMKVYAELRRKDRPTDAEIINLIATTYQVSAAQALEWISQINTTEAQEA